MDNGRAVPMDGAKLAALLQEFWPEHFPSLKSCRRALKSRRVLLNGEAASPGCPPPLPSGAPSVEILYEDDWLACVLKPRGLPMTAPGVNPSVQACLRLGPARSSHADALRYVAAAHRLDVGTGGLLLAAKTRAAERALRGDLAKRRVQKRYVALVWGRLHGRGRLLWTLDGKACHTGFEARGVWELDREREAGQTGQAGDVEEGHEDSLHEDSMHEDSMHEDSLHEDSMHQHSRRDPRLLATRRLAVTAVSLDAHTGRTHQLRRHLALLGHPIVGDATYTAGYRLHRHPDQGEAVADEAGEMFESWPEAGKRTRQHLESTRRSADPDTAEALQRTCLWAVELTLSHPDPAREDRRMHFMNGAHQAEMDVVLKALGMEAC